MGPAIWGWLRCEDSNLGNLIQSQVDYHYPTPQWVLRCQKETRIQFKRIRAADGFTIAKGCLKVKPKKGLSARAT